MCQIRQSPFMSQQHPDPTAHTPLFPLQDQLLRCRKDLAAKQNEWKREKVMLLQRCQILNMQIAELKHRESNLKKVNETLTLALNKVHDDGNDFKVLVEGLKNNTLNTTEAIKEDRKKLEGERRDIEREVRARLDEEWRDREREIRAHAERELEDKVAARLREQEAHIRRSMTFDREKSERELKQIHYEQCQKLKTQLERVYRQLDRVSVQQQLATSTLLQNQPIVNRTLLDQNPTNIATDLLCQVCGVAFPANQFSEHMEVCNGSEEQDENNYQSLVRKKRHVESQLELLGRMEKRKGQQGGNYPQQQQQPRQVMYVISDDRKKSNIEKEIKSIIKKFYNDKPEEDYDYSRFSIKNSVLKTSNRPARRA